MQVHQFSLRQVPLGARAQRMRPITAAHIYRSAGAGAAPRTSVFAAQLFVAHVVSKAPAGVLEKVDDS